MTSAFYHDAISPAFIYDYDNLKWTIAATQQKGKPRFSTVTESNWRVLGARVFLQDSLISNLLPFVIGIILSAIVCGILSISICVEKKIKQK